MLKRIVIVIGVLIFCIALFALWRYLGQIDLRAVLSELRQFSAARFALAVALVLGYLALNSCNEVILFRAATQRPLIATPMLIATIANPIGHSVGLTTLSSGALRLRLYGALGVEPQPVAHIVATSVLPFLLGAPCMIGLALLLQPNQAGTALRIPAWLAMTMGAALLSTLVTTIVGARHGRNLHIGRWQLRLPSRLFLSLELLLGMGEIMLVGGVLYLFLPSHALLGYLNFIALYLIAVVLAQISNAPAGLGVLEAALITLLPALSAQQVLAAIIGYRAAFELVPLAIALVLWLMFELGSRVGVLGRLWRQRLSD